MKLVTLGIILTLIGFMVVFIAALLPAVTVAPSSAPTSSATSGGTFGFILIGPFPIIIGSAPSGTVSTLVGLGIIFTIIAIIFFVVSWLLAYRWSKNRPYPPM